jgi:DNA-binding transcriptional LysR family regulator
MADRPTIAVVADDSRLRSDLTEDLGRRFEPDFRVMGVSSVGLAAIGGLRSRRVRVAGFQSALSTVVTDAAAKLRASAPGVELSLVDLRPDLALQQLREDVIDVAVVFRYDDNAPEDMRFTHLFDDPMHPLSKKAGQTLADHRESPWIAGCERCRRELVSACQAAGFTPQIMYTSDDPVVEQSLVAAGLGVTTIPGLALTTYRVPGIETTELSDFRRRVYVATYGEPPDPPATDAFVQSVLHAASRITRLRDPKPASVIPPRAVRREIRTHIPRSETSLKR